MADIDEIIGNFTVLDDWDDRYRYLIELGRELPPLPEAVRNRRKTGFTLPINEWLKEEGRVEFGKRSWARKVYEVIFAADRGRW